MTKAIEFLQTEDEVPQTLTLWEARAWTTVFKGPWLQAGLFGVQAHKIRDSYKPHKILRSSWIFVGCLSKKDIVPLKKWLDYPMILSCPRIKKQLIQFGGPHENVI
jgi:hypothetical protein